MCLSTLAMQQLQHLGVATKTDSITESWTNNHKLLHSPCVGHKTCRMKTAERSGCTLIGSEPCLNKIHRSIVCKHTRQIHLRNVWCYGFNLLLIKAEQFKNIFVRKFININKRCFMGISHFRTLTYNNIVEC